MPLLVAALAPPPVASSTDAGRLRRQTRRLPLDGGVRTFAGTGLRSSAWCPTGPTHLVDHGADAALLTALHPRAQGGAAPASALPGVPDDLYRLFDQAHDVGVNAPCYRYLTRRDGTDRRPPRLA